MTREEIVNIIRAVTPEAEVIDISTLGPGIVDIFVTTMKRGAVSEAAMNWIEVALRAYMPVTTRWHLRTAPPETIRAEGPRARKYPGECPCGIASVDCEYHAGMEV